MVKRKAVFSTITSVIIFILVCFAWYLMFTHAKGETFAQRGFSSLKYFTVDSNLMMGIAALVHTVFSIKNGGKPVPGWVELFFYTATTAVALTFSMVMLYLGPIFGYNSMFTNANLYFHLIIPVLSILAFCAFHGERHYSLKESFLTLTPLFLYVVYYLGIIIHYGLSSPKADWYNLAIGGEKMIPLVFLVITAFTWLLAQLLRLAVNKTSIK